jgi:CRP/FNR family cyclic AMP-dependent transcriptional regulator
MATATVSAISRVPVSSFSSAERRAAHSPYGLPIVDSCMGCKLRNRNSFCMLSEGATQEFDELKHVSSYPEGAMVFLEGQTARGVYVLCQGRAKLTTTNADGKSMILKIAEPGTILGLHACISGKPYEVTVETLQPAQLAFVRREDFLRFLNQHPDACLQAAQHLAHDCQSAYEVIRSIGLSHSVSEKLARLLLQWSTDARVMDGAIHLKLALTHEEMAQLIGTSRETVTRTLTEFKNAALWDSGGDL